MTQGIRAYVAARFVQLLPQFRSGELTGTAFRKSVMDSAVKEFGISVASAATHYNHSLKQMRLTDAKAVDGLGRPEGKKGGRKPKVTVDVIKVKTGEVVAANVSRGAAEFMIAQAQLKKKAKLAILDQGDAAPVADAAAEPVAEAVAA